MPNRREHPDSDSGPNWSRINQWLLWLGLAAAVAWLFFGHGEHLLQLAPLLILLACPLMHLFGHGHGGHGSHDRSRDDTPAPRKPAQGSSADSAGHAH